MRIEVRTQAEFDTAFAKHGDDPYAEIVILSERGVWIDVRAYGSATVTAYGSATVRAYDSATVRAYGSATVRAYDSATVTTSDSATVTASDLATVTAYGSATVRAYDSATVRAYGSATVTASDSATVRASGSATVTAYGSATVRAYDSATVTATKYVAVHLYSARVTVSGGVVIDVTAINQSDPTKWADYTGAQLDGSDVLLYKAVDANLIAGHGYTLTAYPIGETVTAPDWKPTSDCGHGLHASPWPEQALAYADSATRMLLVSCPLADLRPIPGSTAKAKAQAFRVLREVNLDGSEIA